MIYTLAGAMTGLAAFNQYCQNGSATANVGNQLETQILIALVLGGMLFPAVQGSLLQYYCWYSAVLCTLQRFDHDGLDYSDHAADSGRYLPDFRSCLC